MPKSCVHETETLIASIIRTDIKIGIISLVYILLFIKTKYIYIHAFIINLFKKKLALSTVKLLIKRMSKQNDAQLITCSLN